MEEQSGIKTWQWVVTVVIIIVLVILGYFIFKNKAQDTTGDTNTDTSSETATDSKDVSQIVISDQFPGNIVYISSVRLANPGFVAIHKDNNGTPGDIIGTQYFDKGINPGKITLTASTIDGKLYYAMLHSDDGDKKFDAKKDLPLKDSSGNIIMKPFRATTNISEVKG